MAGKGSVKLSIYSTFDNKGTKQAERAMRDFTKQYGKVDAATGALKLDKTTQSLAEQSIKADQAAQKWAGYSSTLKNVGSSMTAAVTLPIVGVGVAAKASYDAVRSGADNAIKATGAVGEQAEAMEASFKTVASRVKGSFEDIGSAVGEVNTRFGFTGDKLNDASTDFLKFAEVTGINAVDAVQKVSRYMGDAGIDAGNYREVLDQLTAAAQASGIGIDALTEDLTKYGAPMRALGFDTKESIAIFSQWEKAGVNTEIAFSGMKKAISNWTAEGKDAKQEFGKMVKGVQDGSISAQDAMKAFGAKAGPDLIDAIKGGRFAYEDMLKVVEDSKGSLDGTFDPLVDGTYKADLAMQNAQLALADVGKALMDSLAPAIEDGTKLLNDFASWWKSLDDDQRKNIITIAGVVAAIGPLLMAGSKVASMTSAMIGGYGKLTAQLAKFSTGSKVAAGAAKLLNGAVKGLAAGVAVFAAVEVVAQVVKFTDSLRKSHQEAQKSIDELGKVGDGMKSFGEKMSEAKSMVGDVNDILTSSGRTVGEVSEEIKKHEDAITGIIATALSEQRQLRQDDLDDISNHNAKIAELEDEKVQGYVTRMGSIASSAQAEEHISDDHAAQMLKTQADYFAKSKQDVEDAANDRNQRIENQFRVEGSMTQEEHDEQIRASNKLRDEKLEILEDANAKTIDALANHRDRMAEISQDTVDNITAAKSKIDHYLDAGEIRDRSRDALKEMAGDSRAYSHHIEDDIDASKKVISEGLHSLATEGNSAYLKLQMDAVESSGQITSGNKKMIDTLLDQFKDLPPGVQDSADKAMRKLAEGMDDKLGIDVANSTATQIIDAYRSKVGKAKVVGGDTGKAYASGLSSNAKKAVDAAAKVTGMTLDQFADMADKCGIKGDDATTAFALAIEHGAPVAEAAATASASSAIDGFNSVDGWAPGTGLGDELAGGVGSKSKLMSDTAAYIAGQGVAGFGGVDMRGPGAAKGGELATGLTDKKEPVRTAGVTLIDSAIDGAKSKDGSGAGDNFVSGFVGKLTSGDWLGAVWDAASALGSWAVKALNHGQAAQSPSRKTRQSADWFAAGFVGQLGKRRADSYAAGYKFAVASLEGGDKALRGGMASVAPAAMRIANRSDADRAIATTRATIAAEAAMYQASSSQQPREVRAYVDPDPIAQAVAKALPEALGSMGVYLDSGAIVGGMSKKMERSIAKRGKLTGRIA